MTIYTTVIAVLTLVVAGVVGAVRLRCAQNDSSSTYTITGDHSEQYRILLIQLGKNRGFCVYHRFYLPWSPVNSIPGICLYLVGINSTYRR